MAAPSQYQQYVDYLNKQDDTDYYCFWFYQKPLRVTYVDNNGYSNDLIILLSGAITDYTWVCSNQYNNSNVVNFNDARYYHETPYMFPVSIKRLDITSSDGQGTPPYSFNDSTIIPNTHVLYAKRYYGSTTYEEHYTNFTKTLYSYNKWLWSYTNISDTISGTVTYSTSGSLDDVLDYVTRYYRNVDLYVDGDEWGRVSPVSTITSNGGGATHIAKVTGQLKDLSSNLSDILLVSGGGGGGFLIDNTVYIGVNAGGISGSSSNSGNQSSGYAFGQGQSSSSFSGGGGGLYGGYAGSEGLSSGAGSGYIGNPLLSNKKMVGYNVPTSEDEDDKTESSSMHSETPTQNLPKAGNGYVRIKFIRPVLD